MSTRLRRAAVAAALGTSMLCAGGVPAIRAQGPAASGKQGTTSLFAPAQTQFLLLFVEKDQDAFERLIAEKARGWSIYRDAKAAAGKTRTYLLIGNPADGEFAESASFIESLRPYVAATPGNLLKSDARLSMPFGSGGTAPADARAADAEPAPGEWTFTGDLGLILFFVRPANRAQFESTLEKVRVASHDPVKSDGTPGKDSSVFRIADLTPNGLQIYLLLIAPVAEKVNYAIGPVLGRTFSGAALLDAYTDYAASVGGANLFDLERVTAEQ